MANEKLVRGISSWDLPPKIFDKIGDYSLPAFNRLRRYCRFYRKYFS